MKLSEILFEGEDGVGIYCTGLCGEFAVALSEVFGYELGSIVQVVHDEDYDEDVKTFVHAFCYHPTDNSLGIDAIGIRSIDEMMEDAFVSGDGKLVVEPTTRRALDDQTMEGLDEGSIEVAKGLIEQNRKRYEVI